MESSIIVKESGLIYESTKSLSLLSVFCIFLGVIIFGYIVSGEKHKFMESPKNQTKDFSISYSIANGFIPGTVVFLFLSGIFLFRLLYIRKSKKFYYLRYILIFLIVSIIISLIWVTPLNYNKADNYTKDEKNFLTNSHAFLAFIAFTSSIIFVLITYRLLYLNYKDKVFVGLSIISVICYFILVSAALVAFFIGKSAKTIRDGQYIFDAFELINAGLLSLAILFYGFYGLKSLKQIS